MTTSATVTCPHCATQTNARMPEDACVQRWVCPACKTELRPAAGDCCVYCTHADHPCPPKQEAAPVLPIPGAVGLAIRSLMGAGLVYLGVLAIRDASSYVDGYTDPWGAVLPIVLLGYFTRPVINELVQRPWGWWPSLVPLAAIVLAIAFGAISGAPFGPAFGITLWVWTIAFMFLLGPAFLLAVVTRTPGCEMRSFAYAWARMRGREPDPVSCPGFIDKWDHVRLFGKW